MQPGSVIQVATIMVTNAEVNGEMRAVAGMQHHTLEADSSRPTCITTNAQTICQLYRPAGAWELSVPQHLCQCRKRRALNPSADNKRLHKGRNGAGLAHPVTADLAGVCLTATAAKSRLPATLGWLAESLACGG